MKLNEALEFVDRLFDALSDNDKRQFADGLRTKCDQFGSLQLKAELEDALTQSKASRNAGPKTPRAEQKAQHEWLAKWVAEQPGGVTTAGAAVNALQANFSSFASHANPRSTALGRIRSAAKLGFIQIDGLGSATDWRQVSVRHDFVVRERAAKVRAERVPVMAVQKAGWA